MTLLRSKSPFITVLLVLGCLFVLSLRASAADNPKDKITHGFLATGGDTYIMDGDGTRQ